MGILHALVVLVFTAPALAKPGPFGMGDGLPFGLGDREPTAEEAAYVSQRLVDVDSVRPNALSRARAFASGRPSPMPDSLASSADNSTAIYFPPIRSQGAQGSCTAWAAGYYYNTYTQARDAGIDVSGGDNSNICSPAFLYPLVNDGVDYGAYTPYVVTRLNDVGCASWATMPYSQSDWTTWPTKAAWVEALQWRTKTAYSIDGSSQAGITAIKQHVANGNVAVTRFSVYWTWYTQYPNNATGINNRVYYAQAGSYAGGHAVTIVGYDDNRSYVDHRDGQTHTGAFLVANSWGSSWGWYNSTEAGSKGFFWVAYSMFLESSFGPYVYFNSDRADYEPTLYASAGINHTQRGRVTVRAGIGPTGSPEYSGPYPVYYAGGNTLAMTDAKQVVVDLTAGASLFQSETTKQVFVRLAVSGAAASDGTITAAEFTHDLDGDGTFDTVSSTDPTVTVSPGSAGYATAEISIGPADLYVDAANVAGPWDGSEDNPYLTIQAGIDAAEDGDTIHVAAGTYTGAGNIALDFGGKAITVQSDDGPSTCIVDCEGADRGFIFQTNEDTDSVLDGFTITNGQSADNGGAILCSSSSPTIRNCRITGNTAATSGGGLYATDSGARIVNCTITGNEATLGSGGGIYLDIRGNISLVNCTVAANVANDGGAVFCSGGDPEVTNCILWSNTPDGFITNSGTPTVNYCDVQDGWSGEGSNNINTDPLFVDLGSWDGDTWTEGDYRLQAGSPCIDSGLGDDGATVPMTDIEGGPRRDDPAVTNTGSGVPAYVDMGAYERVVVADDVVLRNSTTGMVAIWYMNGTQFCASGTPGTVEPALGLAIKGVGDFDGDGKADLLWRNMNTGSLTIWFMDGMSVASSGNAGTIPISWGWTVKGVADFDGDGKADILMRNANTGQVAVWLMDGLTCVSDGSPATVPVSWGWVIQGVGDFDGDTKADVLWRNENTGQVSVWLMNGLTIASDGSPATIPVSWGWEIKNIGDFDGDGKADVLLRNSASGMLAIWLMDGLTISSDGTPGTIPVSWGWAIKGTGDFDGDGKDDVLLRNTTIGLFAVWLMDGTAYTTSGVTAAVPISWGWVTKGIGNVHGSPD